MFTIINIVLIFSLNGFAQTTTTQSTGPSTTAAPWLEVEAKIGEYYSKVRNKEDLIKKLLEEKQGLPEDSPKAKPLVDQLIQEHKELQNLIEEYEKNKNVLQYRYPERGAQAKRKYDKKKKQSLEEMEKAFGIDASLNRSLKTMRKHYDAEAGKEDSKILPTSTTQRPPTKPIDQSEPVLIRK